MPLPGPKFSGPVDYEFPTAKNRLKKIVLYGNLPRPASLAENIRGVGVASYFAELHSETNKFQFLCGMAAVTCASASRVNNWVPCGNGPSDLNPGAYVVALLDTRDPVGTGAPFGSAGLGD